ncbi:LacI family DNA-binding transcriptional regulator [Pseudolysinimonas kribbensis]|uniref:Alanine racemase n=1 Tax=Pseudolysinimonas kribbensis TaxID=433641 RepID=A0ABQ6K6P6_9MICO|nr:alanine racemase [Pseudolysinimonas kribbensis]
MTLADVARMAGVSSASASLILNRRAGTRISSETQERVRTAARELGYRPNIAAQSLRTDKSHTVAFVSDFVSTTRFAARMIRGAMKAADELGQVLIVVETEGDVEREARAMHTVLDRQVDGIILAAERARAVDIPDFPDSVNVIMLNAMNDAHPHAILPDELQGGRTAVRELTAAGHRDIGLVGYDFESGIGGSSPSVTLERRMHGIREQMAADRARFIAQGGSRRWEPEEGYRIARAQLRAGPVRAFLCLNDRLAFGAYQAIAEAGLTIPDDISVVSFDDDDISSYLRPGLTTVALPHEAMGRLAVERLYRGSPAEEVLVAMPSIRRGSVAPLSVGARRTG